jgi:hypothetical protein
MGIKVAFLEENKKMQGYYIVPSTKNPQKYHLGHNWIPHFFILQSAFSVRHEKEARDKKQEPR